MKNSEYWRRRSELLEAETRKSAGKLTAEIERQFNLARKTIDEQIEQWHGRFAANNQITLTEARRWMTGKDLAEFKWDVSEYIKYGKEAAADPALMKQLENASARFHISKLEALKVKTQMAVERLYGPIEPKLESAFAGIYRDNYYHAAYELQKGVNIGWDVAAVDERRLESVLSKPWTTDNKTFSDRWGARKKDLVDTIHTVLTQKLITGETAAAAIAEIAKKFGASKSNAARLVYTESAYFANEAQRKAYESLDVEEVEVVAALDGLTCKVCGRHDGEHFPMSRWEVGVTAPIYHANCRCCTAPYFDDDDGERIARGEDGEQYYVPSDMKYAEWKKTFVDGGSKAGLQSADENDIIVSGGPSGAKKTDGWRERHAELFYEEVRHRSTDVKKIAANTPFTEKAVGEIKRHMFFKEHKFRDGRVERFWPDFDQSQTWDRLTQGTHTELDVTLLKHEYVELTQMRVNGYDYDTAHEIANKYHNWALELNKSRREEGGK